MTNPVMKRRAPILDGRLSAAMDLAEGCLVFADIGADHGRLSTVMLLHDERRYGLVADISALALEKARVRITRMGLADRVTFAVSDGLSALEPFSDHQPDTIFILGMGGETVSGILQRGFNQLRGAAVILGAQTELPLVRQTLCSIGYRIRREVIASESGRDYILMRAEPAAEGEPAYTEEEMLLGPVLLQELPPSWKPILERRRRLLQQGIDAMNATRLHKDHGRLSMFEREIGYVQRALDQLRKEEKL